MSELRTRFAPSPTGYLHIGGARTALFNWLLAKQQGGKFILRIEDTDRERSTQESIDAILDGMYWLGLDHDEGPYYQTKRYDLYQEQIDKLLAAGKAYKCFCTKEELDIRRAAMQKQGLKPKYDGLCRTADQNQDKPHCIRFISPEEGTTTVHDELRGDVVVQNSELDDLIIRRTDGNPTYNLVVVVDDATMKINYVIRGDDHLNNTSRQVQLYGALDFPVPRFAHLPMILGDDKKRLSKRHGATSVLAYKDEGYLPNALLNFLARLGWSHGDQELFSREELIEKFSMEAVGRAAGVFNAEKLLWVNFEHMKLLSAKELLEHTAPFLDAIGATPTFDDYGVAAIESVREKAKTLKELAERSAFYFRDLPEFEEKSVDKFLGDDNKTVLRKLQASLLGTTPFKAEAIQATVDAFMAEHELKLKTVAQPLRVALVGCTISPSIFETLELLGKERIEKRLKHCLET